MKSKDVEIYAGDDFLLSAKAGMTGVIKVKKNNKIGGILIGAANSGGKKRIVAV